MWKDIYGAIILAILIFLFIFKKENVEKLQQNFRDISINTNDNIINKTKCLTCENKNEFLSLQRNLDI